MASTTNCKIAAVLALSTCPLATQAFVPAGSAISWPETAAPLRGPGAEGVAASVQVESFTVSVPTILSVSGLAGVTAAIAGRRGNKTRTARKAAAEAEAPPPPPKWELATSLGAMAPLGAFDPLGFCDSQEKFKDFRAKELKHGRAAMMGAVGLLVQSIVQVPGMEGVPKNIFAITQGNGLIGGVAILAIMGVLEAVVFVQDPNKEPGDFGNPLPLVGDDYSEDMRLKELNNGRMAMGAFLTIALVSLTTGKSALQQLGF